MNVPDDGMPLPNAWAHINSLDELFDCTFSITVAEEVGLSRLPVDNWVTIIQFVESPCYHLFGSAHEQIEQLRETAGFLGWRN